MPCPILESPDRPLARVSWKASPQEMLASLRDTFGTTHPFLMEESFTTLAESAFKGIFDTASAFGQEITVHGVAMIRIDEDSDDYCLALVPFDQHAECISTIREQTQHDAMVCRQRYEKVGSPAQRVPPSIGLKKKTLVEKLGCCLVKVVGLIVLGYCCMFAAFYLFFYRA